MTENTKGQQNRNGDQSQNSEKDKNRKHNTSSEGQRGSGRSFNSPGSDEDRKSGHEQGLQNASGNKGIDRNEALTGGERSNISEKGSGTATKRNVTGSDYDGQVSE